MKYIITYIKKNGIKENYSEELNRYIQISNIFNIIFLFLVLPFIFLARNSPLAMLITSVPILLHAISFILTGLDRHKIGRFIFSITTATSVYFVAALTYIDSGTDGMAAKFLILGAIILPFIVFKSNEWKYTLFVIIIDLLYIITFNYLNDLLTLKSIDYNIDSAALRIISVFTAFFMFTAVFFYYKNLTDKNIILKKLNIKLQKNNEELQVLNENVEEQKDIIEIERTRLKQLNYTLKESEYRFKFLSNATIEAIFISENDICIDTNKAATNMYGYSYDEMIGMSRTDFIATESIELVKKNINSDYDKPYNAVAQRKNSTKFHATFRTKKYKYKGKEVKFTAVRDITEYKKAEQIIMESKEKIETAHKNITDSINYAKTIQNALLTNKTLIDGYFDEYFLLFKPKEHVSGDFYYVNKINNYIVFAVADCTGHGVPGGFLTMLGITYLHETVRREETDNPAKALNILRQRIKRTFKDFGSENQNGLDIALCAIDTETNILQYAGAYSPLYIIRNSELIEYKATKNPIGFFKREISFKNNEIQLYKNDLIYLFSDGYKDQFGGKSQRSFSKRRFRELILEIQIMPMNEQKAVLEEKLKQWRGDIPQIDDITIMAVKITK